MNINWFWPYPETLQKLKDRVVIICIIFCSTGPLREQGNQLKENIPQLE